MKNTKIYAKIVADSVNPQGDRITTYLLTYPRFIHSELMTHRMFSRNASSSRAVPVDKMIKAVRENTFCPFEFQKSHKGMQGSEYFTDKDKQECVDLWLESAELALQQAEKMKAKGISKQIINRILEPYQYYTVLVTATQWDNFFELRCPKYFGTFKSWKDASNRGGATFETPFEFRMNDSQAEIHIQALAESMWDAYNESIPKKLKSGEWQLPFSDKIKDNELAQAISPNKALLYNNLNLENLRLKVCIARCARLSYMTFDGEIDYEKDIQLHDRLLESKHASPMEHCARAMSEDERAYYYKSDGPNPEDFETGWCRNFRGWIQYRHLVENKS